MTEEDSPKYEAPASPSRETGSNDIIIKLVDDE